MEAAYNGLLAPELANGITRVKGVASKGVRLCNWLTAKQAQALLNAPDASTPKGLRDRAILAVLLGCGLRRSEVAALTFKHIHQRDGRWSIVDLVGNHGRVRTVPVPTWAKVAIDAWASAAAVDFSRTRRFPGFSSPRAGLRLAVLGLQVNGVEGQLFWVVMKDSKM